MAETLGEILGVDDDEAIDGGETAADTATEPEKQAGAVTQTPAVDGRSETVPPEDDPATSGLRKALQAERKLRKEESRKRRDYETQLARMQGHLDATQVRNPTPDKAGEPKELDQFFSNGPGFVRSQVDAARQHAERLALAHTLDMSEAVEADRHEDFDAAKEAFLEAARREPWRLQAVLANPARGGRVVYEQGKRLLEAEEDSDPSKREARLEAELKALREKRGGGGHQVDDSTHQAAKRIPQRSRIAGARGSGSAANNRGADDDDSLESIVSRRAK